MGIKCQFGQGGSVTPRHRWGRGVKVSGGRFLRQHLLRWLVSSWVHRVSAQRIGHFGNKAQLDCHLRSVAPASASPSLFDHRLDTLKAQGFAYNERTGIFRSLTTFVIRRLALTCPLSLSFIIPSLLPVRVQTSLISSARQIDQDVVENRQKQVETVARSFQSPDSGDGHFPVGDTHSAQPRRLTTPIPFRYTCHPRQSRRRVRSSSWCPGPACCSGRFGKRAGSGGLEHLAYERHSAEAS